MCHYIVHTAILGFHAAQKTGIVTEFENKILYYVNM